MLKQIKSCYDNFLEKSEGMDPDYPGINFNGDKGKKVDISGKNLVLLNEEEDSKDKF